jgi:hypothetical protein
MLQREAVKLFRKWKVKKCLPGPLRVSVFMFMDENQAKTMPVLLSGQIPKIIEENQAKNYA